MKKLLLTVPIFCGACLCAQEEAKPSLFFSRGMEAKVKYERYEKENHFRIEGSVFGRIEGESVWADTKVKVCLDHPGLSHDWNSNSGLDIDLDRLLVGCNLYRGTDSLLYVEAGRERMDNLFNSKVQYGSHFNGLHCSFSKGPVTIHAGENILDASANHYGVVGEASYTDIGGLPITVAYNLTDWLSEDDYIISQVSIACGVGTFCNKPIVIYGAVLRNHQASSDVNGVYGGISFGEVKKAKDWMIDAHYQCVGENTIPDFDNTSLMKGVRVKTVIACTDNLSLEGKLDFAEEKCYSVSAIYNYKW